MTTWDGIYRFKGACGRVGIAAPASIDRALELIDLAQAHAEHRPTRLLELADDDIAACVTDLAVRNHTDGALPARHYRGIRAGLEELRSGLLAEVVADVVPRLEEMVVELQPHFAEAAAPLVTAAKQYGFTYRTTSDDVILLEDAAAIDAWRRVRAAMPLLAPFVRFRTTMSEVFDLSPTREEQRRDAAMDHKRLKGDPSAVDYSICFAEGGNWSSDGAFYVDGRRDGHIDWLKLAAGGLRLNTPEEVAAKPASKRPAHEPVPVDVWADQDDLETQLRKIAADTAGKAARN